MENSEVLILNGSPGAGKSTVANEISELLRKLDIPHAVIDVDELARIYPEDDMFSMQWKNLASIWQNYGVVTGLKVIIPVLLDTQKDLEALKSATPCKEFTVCELVAPVETLINRVVTREENEYWQTKLKSLVENYEKKDISQKFSDFKVSTEYQTVEETSKEIVDKLGWSL